MILRSVLIWAFIETDAVAEIRWQIVYLGGLLVSCCYYDKLRPLTGSKWYKFIILQFWRSESKMGLPGLQSRCWPCCIPSGSSRGESISLPFQASRSHVHLLVYSSFFHLRRQQRSTFKTLFLSSSLLFWIWTFPFPFSALRTLVIILGPPG